MKKAVFLTVVLVAIILVMSMHGCKRSKPISDQPTVFSYKEAAQTGTEGGMVHLDDEKAILLIPVFQEYEDWQVSNSAAGRPGMIMPYLLERWHTDGITVRIKKIFVKIDEKKTIRCLEFTYQKN